LLHNIFQFLVLVDRTCLTGCKFEGSHPAVYGQLFIVLVPLDIYM